MNIIMLGAPGAGKGTQAAVLCEHFGIPTISTGNMIREALKNGTEMGLKAKSFMDEGKLVPDEVVIGIVKERLSEDDCKKGFILDGFPRTTKQAELLEEITARLNKPLTNVISIDVKEETLIDRLSARFMCKNCGATYNKFSKKPKVEGTCDRCGGHEFYQREDDKPEVVKNRLEVNEKMNAPLKEFYDKKGLLYTVNGEQAPEKVFADIDEVLSKN